MSSVPQKIDIPGINAEAGLDLCDGNFDIYLQSLNLYVSNMPDNLKKMRSVSEETLHNYAVGVHGVKSISDYIGALDIRDTAKQLEALAKSGDLAGILAQNESFIKRTEIIVESIRNWLVKNNCLKT